MAQFKKRRVGRADLEVTELGLGTATLAGIFSAVPEDQVRTTVGAAIDAGIGYIDTAPYYGFGRAEHLTGDALRPRARNYVLSTKVGRTLHPLQPGEPHDDPHNWVDPFPFDQIYDYSYAGVMRSFEDSLQRMGLSRIDMLLVHDIGTMTHGEDKNRIHWQQLADGGYRALKELRASGAIKAIGFGVNEWEVLMEAFKLGDWDVFLLAGRYTLLEQTSLDPFLTTCVERGATIVVGGPFNGGALMGTGTWNYEKAPEHISARVRELEAFCTAQGVPIGAAALQFPLAHKAISTVLPGPRSPDELAGILEWWATEIPDGFWDALADKKLVAPGTPLPNGRTA